MENSLEKSPKRRKVTGYTVKEQTQGTLARFWTNNVNKSASSCAAISCPTSTPNTSPTAVTRIGLPANKPTTHVTGITLTNRPTTTVTTSTPASSSTFEIRPQIKTPRPTDIVLHSEEEGTGKNRIEKECSNKKAKLYTTYTKSRKYKVAWEKQYGWVKKSEKSEYAMCKLCKKTLAPRKNILADHEKSAQHTNCVEATNLTAPITLHEAKPKSLDKIHVAELNLAATIVCHCSISAVDHLGEIIARHGKGSVLEKIKLHRTKCTRLITKVISPSLEKMHKEKYKKVSGYSLIVDEATDVASDKHFAILLRYYSEQENVMKTILLGLQPVVETTGEALFRAVQKQAQESGLDLSKCIGYGSDGSNNMVGEHNSLWSRMKEVSPHCVQMKCICHSFALCVKHAFEKLPSHIGFLSAEIPKWFKKSAIRRDAFKQLYQVMNPDEESSASPFTKLSATRWLVRGKVMHNILVNWDELKAYFLCCREQGKQDVRYKARLIADMLLDDGNKAYFHFVVPIIQEFEAINSFFQSTNIDPDVIVKKLDTFYRALKNRIYTPDGRIKPRNMFDYGAKFLQALALAKTGIAKQEDAIKERCADMLLELLAQVESRIPDNSNIYSKLNLLKPETVLSHTKRASFMDLPMRHLFGLNEDAIESQYRRIVCENWRDFFDGNIPSDSIGFWGKVLCAKEIYDGYGDLARYALTCLCTPISNAVVERIFSLVTSTKSKTRNRLLLNTLVAILRLKTVLSSNPGCCKEFNITGDMLDRFDSSMYDDQDDQDEGECFVE